MQKVDTPKLNLEKKQRVEKYEPFIANIWQNTLATGTAHVNSKLE